jgi:hypothetical protein
MIIRGEVILRYKLGIFVALLSLPSFGSVMTYSDYGNWAISAAEQPNVNIVSETFANNQVQTPELSITTLSGMGGASDPGNGVIANNSWTDCVGKDACNSLAYDVTIFSFSKPVYALAGDWDMPAGSGLEIYTGTPSPVSPNQYEDQGHLAGSAFSGFFGFVSDTPFDSVVFASSTGQQSFTLSDLSIGIDPPPSLAAPEPSTLALLGAAGIALGFTRKRLCK